MKYDMKKDMASVSVSCQRFCDIDRRLTKEDQNKKSTETHYQSQ